MYAKRQLKITMPIEDLGTNLGAAWRGTKIQGGARKMTFFGFNKQVKISKNLIKSM